MSSPTPDLADRHCVPCEGGVTPFTPDEARLQLKGLNVGWAYDEATNALKREFRFRNFYQVMSFVNAVAHIANLEDHHPDLEVGYDYCRISYTTHAIQGLSENDFICAAKIDRL
jgi:4a-hydroxytetrahydrobiopterin dehydratase